MNQILFCFQMVFSKWIYVLIAGSIASIFWILFNIFDQLLFFSPIVIFYLPPDAVVGFILTNLTSILLGIVVSMNAYVLRHSKLKLSMASFLSGSSLSVTFKHMRQLFFFGISSCFHIWRSRNSSINVIVQLSNTLAHCVYSTSNLGFILNK